MYLRAHQIPDPPQIRSPTCGTATGLNRQQLFMMKLRCLRHLR